MKNSSSLWTAIMNFHNRNILVFLRNYYFFLLLLIPILGKLAIVVPTFPVEGLDPSWQLALGVASSKHMIFGKDIIYTFGPLSSVETGCWAYNGHTLTSVLSFITAFILCLFIYKFFIKACYLVKFLLFIFFFVNINSMPDFYFCLLPAIATLVLLEIYSNSKFYQVYISLFGFIVALLLLVKLSFGVEAFLDLVLLLVFYAIKKDKKCCIALVVSFSLAFIVLFIASGQKFSGIIYYPFNIYYGVAGYNEAMSSNYDSAQPAITSSVFLVLLLCFLVRKSFRPLNLQGIFRTFVLALLFLIVFKHSYVRNDAGHHADIYLLMCFLLIYILHAFEKSVIKNILITICVLSLLFIGSKEYWYFFNGSQVKNAYATLVGKVQNKDRLFYDNENETAFKIGMQSIRNSNPLPSLKGTSDIYDFNQAILLASNNKWNPRPAFQSYQAVTSYLVKANYDHLINNIKAPDNIFFKMEVIDGRFPSMNDGLSWAALLGAYRPIGWTNKKDYLILKRDEVPNALAVKNITQSSGEAGHEIINPYDSGIVFVKIHLRKTLFGTLISMLYKTEPVMITVKLQNDQDRTYRIIPSMSETGFLLSPFTESTLAFSDLYGTGYFAGINQGNRVKSIIINPNEKYQYSDSFDVTFEQREYPDKLKALIAGRVHRADFNSRIITRDTSINSCVDIFDYQIGDGKLSISFSGWAFKKNVDILKSSFALLLVDQKQKSDFEIPLDNQNRKDVSDFFNDGHNYAMSGFSVKGLYDILELKPNIEYKLYLKMNINGTEYIFPVNKSLIYGQKEYFD